MRQWNFNNIKVVEAGHDGNLHKFNVYDNDYYLGSIYPATIEQMEDDARSLDNGSNPIADGWEDGNGNTCTIDGWNKVVKYDTYRESKEIGYKKFCGSYEHGSLAAANVPGINSYNPEYLGQYNTAEEAIASLAGETSRSWETQGPIGTLLFAEEYWVSEATYIIDEDGDMEYDCGGDIVYIAPSDSQTKTTYRVEYKWKKGGEWSDYFEFDSLEEALADVERERHNIDEDDEADYGLEAYRILDDEGDVVDEGWGLTFTPTIRKIRDLSGMTRMEFSKYLGIPYRTLQDWELGKAQPADYLVDLIDFRVRNRNLD